MMNDKQMKLLNLKLLKGKKKSPFMIYTDFESIVIVPEKNDKYQNHASCCYG